MLEIKGDQFFINNEKINIYSGAIHYFRVPKEYWEDRLTKLKLAGFNTVETYVSWNLHEPRQGEWDFSGMLDIVEFIKTAQKVGLYAIVRPGPYICAEWDFGGFPAWLLKDKNMRLRTMHADYLRCVDSYYKALLTQLIPLQATNGGNIIAMQVENEYGSYGNDKEYLSYIEHLMRDCGVDVLLFTSDGGEDFMLSGGTLPHIFKVLNFGTGEFNAFKPLERVQPNAPKMCGEFWCGWFDHWGSFHHKRHAASVIKEVKSFLKQDASFNMYMFHGGTNFGFMAGANKYAKYSPTTTSYDYSAPITECGDYTPTYHAIREILLKKQGLPMLELPKEMHKQNIGEVALSQVGSIWDNINGMSQQHRSGAPETMEYYGQNFGLILYHTEFHGAYGKSRLFLDGLHDRAYVYVNGELKATLDRNDRDKRQALFGEVKPKHSVALPALEDGAKIDILVDSMGRVNYGSEIYDRKGITAVRLGQQNLFGWDVYTFPLDNISKVDFNGSNKAPLFLKGTFTTASKGDCFVRFDGFTKGYIFVNGINLGRYWNKGPQKALYLPGVWLKEKNELVILELDSYKNASIVISDKPDLG